MKTTKGKQQWHFVTLEEFYTLSQTSGEISISTENNGLLTIQIPNFYKEIVNACENTLKAIFFKDEQLRFLLQMRKFYHYQFEISDVQSITQVKNENYRRLEVWAKDKFEELNGGVTKEIT